MPDAAVGVIGGSGLYQFLGGAELSELETPYGPPSGPLTVASLGEVRVAFLPRHGPRHTISPHRINYRANLHALQQLGVRRVIGPCAVGSLRRPLAPGHLVVCDQLIDRTWGRDGTFFDGPQVAHLAMASPYCSELRPLAVRAAQAAGMPVHDGGVVLVNQGPRFATAAESRMHAAMGADVVNMTQCPEVQLARELGMCYVNLSLVTDYDSGLNEDASVPAVTQQEVLRVFGENVERLRDVLVRLVESVPAERRCDCEAGAAAPMHAG